MAEAGKIRELLERVERGYSNAEEHDALERDLCFAFMDRDDYPSIAALIGYALGNGVEAVGAALALVENVLPGHAAAVGNMAFETRGTPWCCIWTPDGFPQYHGEGPTPPLAILAALLRASLPAEGGR